MQVDILVKFTGLEVGGFTVADCIVESLGTGTSQPRKMEATE